MAKAIETLSIKLEFKDAGTQQIISKLSSSLKGMTNVVKGNTSPAISKLRNEILSVGKASTQSISNFRNQANALRALRDEARVGSATFKRLTEDIKKLDAQMGKSSQSTQRRGGARQATQIAGAVISGGIFGGPEGALGAAGGAVLGGVEGAFAGAAIGAAVGGVRQALGETAAYAAEINKLKIALQGVAPSQEDFNFAVETAGRATRELNVPQEQSIRGITRLTAAVTGAGGPVQDAATTFRNVTAAIKATGGSSEDVQGAITAMVQVFSKGKVSAEELSGQLGERLPGAVTLFAKANKMTLPELQKNLKAGTVGLNELMNFIRELGVEFGGTAERIASSNEEAGARLNVAFNEMRLGVGQALMGTGADLQATFGDFIKTTTPGVINATKLLVKAMTPVIKNLDLILVSIAGLASGAVIANVITNLAAIKTGLIGIKVAAAALLINPIFAGAAAAAGIAAGIYLITKAIRDQRSEIERLQGADPGKTIAAYTNEERLVEIAKTKQQLSSARAQRLRLISAGEEEGGFDTTEIDQKIASAEARLARLTAPVVRKSAGADFEYDPVSPDGGGTGTGTKSTLASRLEQAQALESRMQRQLLLSEQQGQIGRLLAKQANERSQLQERIAALKKDGTSADLDAVTASAEKLLLKKQEEERESAIQSLREQANIQVREAMIAASGLGEEEKKRLDIMRTLAAFAAKFKEVLTDEEMLNALKDLREALTTLQTNAVEAGESFDSAFRKSLEDMIDVAPKLANVASSAIGQISDGLVEMIATGEANFKEMAASILKEIAKILMQAAIARTIKMFLSADGNVVQGGRIKPYAQGGVVTAPTLFPMAGGDVGLMGEAGPEAIMPLKRGSNGKLGVEVAGRSNALDAMNRYSVRNDGGGTATMAPSADQDGAGSPSAQQPIDVRYSVERINNVDYVTADQFQAGLQQAASQGAKQGEQQTLRRLQMSSSTRKRLGM